MLTTTISSSLSPTQFSPFHWSGLSRHRRPHPSSSSSPSLTRRGPKTLTLILAASYQKPAAKKHHPLLLLIDTNPSPTAISAGRSKKKPGSPPSGGRIEGSGEVRRRAKENARRRSRRLSENRFYRRNNPRGGKHGDSFTEEELQMIGLGYDRSVRFMAKDDPNLRHPHDWYKYGRYGPYSWRGIVVGPPIRGRFSDERVSLIGEVRDHEEWEEIERFDMASEFSRRLDSLGHRSHYWVFVRHPKWRITDLPWQQWTLVSEVVLEAGKDQRLDKWSLMGRLGNKSRAMVTQCAAWMRPDIIYVKRPVYQCRFEPQDDFFKLLGPVLDPSTEDEYPCHLKLEEEEGRVETCTYFGGLCKIVKISPKAYVDDVVKAYQKLSDDGKSRCLEFLLTNHPLELLHPYTKEWKVKLEEMEMGCDAPDESEDEIDGIESEINWMEDSDDSGADEDEEEVEEDGEVIDVGEDEKDAELGMEEEDLDQKETEEYWDEQWKKALRSSEAMESLVKKSVEVSTEFYKRQMREEEDREGRKEQEARGSTMSTDQEQSRELKADVGKIPPELFLKSAVRPFTYRNLVKEIVLMRHAIVDGDISFSS